MTLYDLVTRTLKRLDDAEARVWSRAEVELYVKDGYDLFCQRTKAIFDFHHVENLPAVGNYSSDEEFELAKQIPNLILTNKRNFTLAVEKDHAAAGSVGPAGVSDHVEAALIPTTIPKSNPTGHLPRGFVDIQRVMHDEEPLYPEFSLGLARNWDNRYEEQTGDTDWFTVDKDGLFTLRRYPGGDGAAIYPAITGFWGGETVDTLYTGEVIGSWGGLTRDPEQFPAGGPWGAPTRTHPDINNTRVEMARLGRDLDSHAFEIPDSHLRYVEFWGCARALKRDGAGQDLKLSKHYEDRFEMGIETLTKRIHQMQSEHTGRIGHGAQRSSVPSLQIHLPYNYGRRIRRSGGGY